MSENADFKPRVVSFGESLIDMIQQADGTYQPVPGGCPMNTVVALSRQNIAAAIVTPVSTDKFGQDIMDHLKKSNVDTSLVTRVDEPTTLAITTIDLTGQAEFTFYIQGSSQSQWGHDTLGNKVKDGDIFHLSGSFALVESPMLERFNEVFQSATNKTNRHTILFDPNIRPAVIANRGKEALTNFDRWVGQSTIVKLSDEDLQWCFPGRNYQEVAQNWVEYNGVALAIVTLGENGAYACTANETVKLPAPSIQVVDTVGAGDSFSAGLLKWLIDSDRYSHDAIKGLTKVELESAMQLAVGIASDTCRREGANPPYGEVEMSLSAGRALEKTN